MNYPCGEAKEIAVCDNAAIEDLTCMMKDTRRMAADALNLSRRICVHMFGIGIPCCEKDAEPKCFRDELVNTRIDLIATMEDLSKICCMLGV